MQNAENSYGQKEHAFRAEIALIPGSHSLWWGFWPGGTGAPRWRKRGGEASFIRRGRLGAAGKRPGRVAVTDRDRVVGG